MIREFLFSGLAAASVVCSSAFATEPPAAYGTVPAERQVDWQRMEYYAFVHLGLNTWTNREWGYGDEDPKLFNPENFDADKIVALFKQAGMKGMILTAKHHDGFCLWPTKTTEHNITKSPWKEGQGNLVKEFAQACKKAGIKFGVYISPWDRNHAEYARPGYLKDYHAQIRELLDPEHYGEIFEIWFDGANGGDGFYGGAKEKRNIPEGYYNFPEIVRMARELQPRCVVWGAGTVGDARWGGSEAGHVNYPCWPTLSSEKKHDERLAGTGDRNGDRWVPAEGDTSIRSGWFWHADRNHTVKPPEKLLDVWFECVGRGANLILNVPPDDKGQIYGADAKSLMEFKELRDRLYARDFARGAKVAASNVRGRDKKFSPQNLVDGDMESYWTTDDSVTTPSVELTLKEPVTFDVVRLREQIRLGQRVEGFAVDAFVKGDWKEVLQGSAIGNQAMLRLKEPVTTNKVRLRITQSPACPTISELSLLRMPVILSAPVITRRGDGKVELKAKAGGVIKYTLDGTEPGKVSLTYSSPLDLPVGGEVKARVMDESGKLGSLAFARFGLSKKDWKIVDAPAGTDAAGAIDEKPNTFWHTHPVSGELTPPRSFTVDMGREIKGRGFTYLPRQDGTCHGMTDKYVFEVSRDNRTWVKAAEGEFSNLRANPIELSVNFNKPETFRYFRFTGTHALEKNHVSAAEVGIVPTSK